MPGQCCALTLKYALIAREKGMYIKTRVKSYNQPYYVAEHTCWKNYFTHMLQWYVPKYQEPIQYAINN